MIIVFGGVPLRLVNESARRRGADIESDPPFQRIEAKRLEPDSAAGSLNEIRHHLQKNGFAAQGVVSGVGMIGASRRGKPGGVLFHDGDDTVEAFTFKKYARDERLRAEAFVVRGRDLRINDERRAEDDQKRDHDKQNFSPY